MSSKPKTFPVILKNMKSAEFQQLLSDSGACAMAREWAAGKSFKIVWKTCKYQDWMQWLIRNRVGYIWSIFFL